MKKTHPFFMAAFLLSVGIASAQTTTTTTTSSTSSDGMIGDFNPNVITVRSTSSSTPISYSSSKTTTYVDENGNPVAVETVHSGAPVTVYYTRDGDTMTATRVVVHRIVTTNSDLTPGVTTTTIKKTTTTTTDNP